MSRFCTTCGFPQDGGCECDQSVTFKELSYTNNEFEVPDMLIRQINSVVDDEKHNLGALARTFDNSAPTGRNVRVATFWSVGSIKTDTGRIDALTGDVALNDFSALKSFLEATRDGEKKWEKVHELWTGGIPEETARHARNGDWVKAQAALIGLNTGDTDRDTHYVRPTKANMVTRIMGDPHALCMDTRRHRVLRPLLKRMLPGETRGADDQSGEYRVQGTSVDTERVPAWSKNHLQDRLTRNPREYRAIAEKILDALERETRADRAEIGHILFLLGGADTFHETLQDLVDTR